MADVLVMANDPLPICDLYQMPISGESQVTNLVNSFIRENRGEVKS